MQPLPIDPLLPRIRQSLLEASSLVLMAPPGAGKTTRVPSALLDAFSGRILVLEPRRLAARMAARRTASEMGERPGGAVGFQVRFEEAAGPRTRLLFLTEGILTHRFLSDPALAGVSVVVLDEFHERHLESDLALALLRRLQRTTRPDLRLLVMSATLDPGPVARYLGGCPVLQAEGRLYPLEIEHRAASAEPLERQVAAALEQLIAAGLDGDVLVFLPGASEIRRAARACQKTAQRHRLEVAMLYGDLPAGQQDRAVQPGPRRKVILSTNIAESSVTIEGITAVIDSGLARVAGHSPWSGLPTLEVRKISKASAAQRAGRAGRIAPGRVIRLYPLEDLARRPERDTPEILRAELSHPALALYALGMRRWEDLEWLEPPPAAARDAAVDLLGRLGAIDPKGTLTAIGRRMANLPLYPRLARLVVEAEDRSVGRAGRRIAALLSAGERLPAERHASGPSDLLYLADQPPGPLTRRIERQLERLARPGSQRGEPADESLLLAILTAFPDRVARRRADRDLVLASGGSALLAPGSLVQQAPFLVAVDVEDRPERGLPLVRLASAIEPDWLIDLFPDRIEERAEVTWNRDAERVEASSALVYDGLVLTETRQVSPDPGQAAQLLAEKAWEAGLARFADEAEVRNWLARVAFLAEHGGIAKLGENDLRAALGSLCRGLRSFADLKAACSGGGLIRALEGRLPPEAAGLLNRLAPERIALPSGRRARIFYEEGRPPWVASRLQDFFGMSETPRIAQGRVPLVVHLLAPNQRPVQVTTDLAGFWKRLYPELRKQLSRRYPRHAWPEDPYRAEVSR